MNETKINYSASYFHIELIYLDLGYSAFSACWPWRDILSIMWHM